MFINGSLLRCHVMMIYCSRLRSIPVPLLEIAAWFSLFQPSVSILSPCGPRWGDGDHGCRVGLSGQGTALPWLQWLVQRWACNLIMTSGIHFAGILLEMLRKRCVFFAGAAKLVVSEAGVPRGYSEGESAWELMRVKPVQKKGKPRDEEKEIPDDLLGGPGLNCPWVVTITCMNFYMPGTGVSISHIVLVS